MNDLMPNTPAEPYTVKPSSEQLKRQQKQIDDIIQSLPVIEEFLADLQELIDSSSRTDVLNVESKVPLESQLLALNEMKKFATQQHRKFTAKYASFKAIAKDES